MSTLKRYALAQVAGCGDGDSDGDNKGVENVGVQLAYTSLVVNDGDAEMYPGCVEGTTTDLKVELVSCRREIKVDRLQGLLMRTIYQNMFLISRSTSTVVGQFDELG